MRSLTTTRFYLYAQTKAAADRADRERLCRERKKRDEDRVRSERAKLAQELAERREKVSSQ